ncbi:unnamed protein product [Ceutorhynchus assimilis]|uniref:Lipase domain-containing protein n=1 Tax=Ceutorhynchus assimilis TaxID=467358 RepID=A0A9N9MG45_9CUCU|nr:unnamed protein product [Ceutorhynchus assimilis]
MNSLVFLVLFFQCVFSQIMNANEQLEAIQAQMDSLFEAEAVLHEQIQAIQALAPSDSILEAVPELISNINDHLPPIEVELGPNATVELAPPDLNEPIMPDVQLETDLVEALISNVYEEIPNEALPDTGTAIISDEIIHQIQAEADAMIENNTILAPSSTVDPSKLFIVVYSRLDPNGTKIPITAAEHINSTSFNPRLRTIIYVFGWTSGVDKPGTVAIRKALLEKTDANVLIVDWSVYTQTMNYFAAYKSVPKTGEYLGQFLAKLIITYPVRKITVVGHSLGAHVAGFAGRIIGGILSVIIALDPAGVFYSHLEASKRLNTGDAKYVTVIHTSYLGLHSPIGHSDFYPNGGWYQKGCTEFMCSHKRAMDLYIESLSDTLYGRKCAKFWLYVCGFCSMNEEKKMGGIYVDTTALGDYYLCTNGEPPYGRSSI